MLPRPTLPATQDDGARQKKKQKTNNLKELENYEQEEGEDKDPITTPLHDSEEGSLRHDQGSFVWIYRHLVFFFGTTMKKKSRTSMRNLLAGESKRKKKGEQSHQSVLGEMFRSFFFSTLTRETFLSSFVLCRCRIMLYDGWKKEFPKILLEVSKGAQKQSKLLYQPKSFRVLNSSFRGCF
jgi:hypothetical protein